MNDKIRVREVSVDELNFEIASLEAKLKQFPEVTQYKEQITGLIQMRDSLENGTQLNGPAVVWLD